MFFVRVLVQVPLYLAGLVGALGVTKLVMGWPLFLLVAYLSYRIMAPVLTHKDRTAATEDPAPAAEE